MRPLPGSVAERLKAPVLKTGDPKGFKGSNPFASATPSPCAVSRPPEPAVAAVQQRVGMTQAQFAARLGFSVATLRHWERGDRKPQGLAPTLPNPTQRDPAGCCVRPHPAAARGGDSGGSAGRGGASPAAGPVIHGARRGHTVCSSHCSRCSGMHGRLKR